VVAWLFVFVVFSERLERNQSVKSVPSVDKKFFFLLWSFRVICVIRGQCCFLWFLKGIGVKTEERYENKRSSGLSVRSRRDRHPKWPIESRDSPSRPPCGGVRSRLDKCPHKCPHLSAGTLISPGSAILGSAILGSAILCGSERHL
jgi:hypothetical protein